MKKLVNQRLARLVLPVVITSALLAATAAYAQQEPRDAKPPRASKGAASFITEAAHGNFAEVHLGQLGQQKSQNAEIKQFAQRLVTDHTKANQQLQTIAQQYGVTFPTGPNRHQEKVYRRLEKLSGSQFDQEFATVGMRDHLKDISDYEKAAKHIQEPALNQYIQQTLPVLREHLQLARSAAKAVGVSPETISSLERKHPEAFGAPGTPYGRQKGTKSSETTEPITR